MGRRSVEHYQYSPLESARHTRLLFLDASPTADSPLTGRLESVNLDDRPSYEALSYEWGNPARTCRLKLDDGSSVSITKSLHLALHDIRHEDPASGPRALWVDAVCINQADVQELQTQVAMMGTIYKRARRVITYMGPHRDDSAEAVDLAVRLHRFCTLLNGQPDLRLHSSDGLVSLGFPPLSNRHWKALRQLILRTWEFILNENLVVLCGRTALPDWRIIPDIVQLVFDRVLPPFFLPGSGKDPKSMRECLASIGELRDSIVHKNIEFTLLDLLSRSHSFRASDPRDKVYSVLGLACDAHLVNIKVDYTCTAETLYLTVATRIIETDPSLDILYGNLHAKTLILPSWVPDWSTWRFGSYGAACSAGYTASGETKPRLCVRGTKLDVKGCVIDRIVSLSQEIGPLYKDYDVRAAAVRQRWLREEMVAFKKAKETKNREPADDADDDSWLDPFAAFWRTLIGDITFDEEPAGADYAPYFHAHLHVREDSAPAMKTMAREFVDAVRRHSRYRRLAVTERGYFGAVPETAMAGDVVVMLDGGEHLFVLRPKESDGEFAFLGHAYVYGLMKGEALAAQWYQSQTITLV